MFENSDTSTRVMIMRSFLAQSGARSAPVAMMMLQREYPQATEEERKAAIVSSQQGQRQAQ
jgi:hypothetical protein